MTEPDSVDFAVDLVRRFRRGELDGEQAADVQTFIKNVEAIFHEHDRERRERAREERRLELAEQADRARAVALAAAAEEAELRTRMNEC